MKETRTFPAARKRRIWPWILAGVVLLAVVAMATLVPAIAVSINYPTLTFDMSPYLEGTAGELVSNKTAIVDFGFARGAEGGYVMHATGKLLDWPFTARVNVQPSFHFFGVRASGDASFRLDDTPWRVSAVFSASSSGEWKVDAAMDETEVRESDPVIGQLISRLKTSAVSNITFNGAISLDAHAERTKEFPVPRWSASCSVNGLDVSCIAGDRQMTVDGFRLQAGASGIAGHCDIKPLFPRINCVTAAGFTFSNVFASVRATERAFLVTEAGAKFCGGDLKMYSLFLDPERLNAGVTLFVDGINAGMALKHLSGFRGEASGRLYGKLPIHMKGGRELRLRTAYLYSVPGETGNLRVYDPAPILDNLAAGGVPHETCDNLSKALADLTYDVLKISLQPDEDGGLALTLKLAGKSTYNSVTVPISLEVTFHGDLEQLVNTGFKTINRR